MLPLHAGSAILLSMCTFCIGYGLGYLQNDKPKTKTLVITVPPAGAKEPDNPTTGEPE